MAVPEGMVEAAFFLFEMPLSNLEQGKQLQHFLLDRVAKFTSVVSWTGSGFHLVGRTPYPFPVEYLPPPPPPPPSPLGRDAASSCSFILSLCRPRDADVARIETREKAFPLCRVWKPKQKVPPTATWATPFWIFSCPDPLDSATRPG